MDKEQVEKARQQFDQELHTTEYRQIHGDKRHLDDLLRLFEFKEDGHFLDLGTGDGYLAFTIAARYGSALIEGLDITEKAIARNNQIARQKGLKNIKFRTYNGFSFPYADNAFDGVISRYALHHFPDINRSIREINRVLNRDGFFILSDPKTYDIDSEGFIDKYQKLKQDGHNHFYYEEEICMLFKKHGFAKENIFYSSIRYPRKYGVEYQKLLNNVKDEIIKKYEIEITDHDVFIKVQVMNILFRKKHSIAIEKKTQILEVLKSDEYEYKQEVQKYLIHLENIYINEWKAVDLTKELKKQKQYWETRLKQIKYKDYVARIKFNQIENAKRFLAVLSKINADTIIHEVRLPGLRRNYYLLIDLQQQKVLAVNCLTLPV